MDPSAHVPADAPPLFAAVAADDSLLAHRSLPIVSAWQAKGRPVELHLYETGGHGFGARGQGTSSDIWFDNLLHWLRSRGQLA
jgi:acetyl esterase/lipase